MQLMLIVRALRQIIEDLLADPRFKGCQFLSFERQERNGVLTSQAQSALQVSGLTSQRSGRVTSQRSELRVSGL